MDIFTNLFESSQIVSIKDKNALRKIMRKWGIPQLEITYVVTNHSQLPDGTQGLYIANEDSGVMLVTSTNYENVPIIKFYIRKDHNSLESEKSALIPGYVEFKVNHVKNFFEERKRLSKKAKSVMMKLLNSNATDSPRKAYNALDNIPDSKFVCAIPRHLNFLLATFNESFDSNHKQEKYGNIAKLSSSYPVKSDMLDQMLNVKLGSDEARKALGSKVYLTSAYLPDGKPGIFVAGGNGLAFVLGRQDRQGRLGMEIIFCYYEERVKKFLEIDGYQSKYKEYDKSYHSKICTQARNVLREFIRNTKDMEKKRHFEDYIDEFVDKYSTILYLRD